MIKKLLFFTFFLTISSIYENSLVYAESNRDDYNSFFRESARYERRGGYGGKQIISYHGREKIGTIIIDTRARHLDLILSGGQALRYGVGVGREGFQWSGVAHIGRTAIWPTWTPPKQMIVREWVQNKRHIPDQMVGGIANPLGARALYLFRGNRDTLYRIHGTNAPETIGYAVSSGCIRMLNEEVIDLFNRVKPGTKVIVL